MRNEFLVFGSPRIEQDEIDEVVASMETGWLGTGPKVAQFESDFCDYKDGWGHPVAVNSCTAALHLSMLSAGVGPGDEVITTPLTFCATVNAILHTGATPVLADVDRATYNIDPREIEKKVTARTKAIVPVHFAGRPCNMDAIMAIADEHRLSVVEDCAHAIETTYRGKHAGTIGDFGCYSFYVTKNIVTGEGGMILAKESAHAQRLKTLALHGMSKDAWKRFGDDGYKHYKVVECGYKYNMMDLQAAIGIHQLKKVGPFWDRRSEIWEQYNRAFENLPIETPPDPAPETKHGLHLYTILVDVKRAGLSRDLFLTGMTEKNMGVGVHYLSLPEHPYYQDKLGWSCNDYPHAAEIGQQTVSLPISAKLSDTDVRDVIEAVSSLIQR